MPALTRPDPLRQSYIQRADSCMKSLLLDLQQPAAVRSPSVLAARGALFHTWAAAALELLRANGEHILPVEAGLELLHEVVSQRDVAAEDVVELPMQEAEWLRIAVTRWCSHPFTHPERIIGIEDRLYGTLVCLGPDGTSYERQITGRPDVVMADPPDGAIVLDWKTGWAPPAAKRIDDPERDDRLSDHGFVQQVVYGLLILRNYPAIQRVTLREAYLMFDEFREATIHRWKLERYEDLISELVARIDAAIDEGPKSKRWVATAGTHCSMCPAPLKCPVRRHAGYPVSESQALDLFREWHVSAERRKRIAPLLKSWVDAHGDLEVAHAKGRRRVGWNDGGTRFGLYEPKDAPDSPFEAREEGEAA